MQPGPAADRLTWAAAAPGISASVAVAVERLAAGDRWIRVTPWLPESATAADAPRPPGAAARRYRLVARGARGDLGLSAEVVTP